MKTLLFSLGVLWSLPPGKPWLRESFEDSFVVARSEQIVIGHLQENSIRYIEHPHAPDEGGSCEYLVTLIVTNVIKGNLQPGPIALTIHYGLTPTVVGADNPRDGVPAGAIEIWDSGNSGVSPFPVLEDARRDSLWFLRRRGDHRGDTPGVGNWGVVDPEDLSPLAFKEIYLAYLSGNPEPRLEALSANDPKIAKRCATFLHPPDLKTILAEDHEYLRAEKLLLFLIKNYRHRKEDRFREDLDKAGTELLRLFEHDRNVELFRGDIMMVWSSLQYEPGVDLLIRLLRGQGEYWANLKLEDHWMQTDVRTFALEKYRAGDARCAIIALRRIAAPAARQELEATRQRWVAQGEPGRMMVQECDAALKALPPK